MDSSVSERPTSPLSQPSVPSSNGSARDGDGNLFYAYARKGDDLTSRYLLTFASASVANEWYSLVQSHFPSTTRPGSQLFSFKTDDMLPKAWRHPAFEHLQSKWMYISFSDTTSEGVGGAAQGIIPVQDVHGNLLGGAASPSSSPEIGKARKEVRDMKEGVGRLEEHFEKMMEAVERNTEGVRKLVEEREENREDGHGRSVDKSELSGHIARMADVLERNTEYIDTMSKRRNEHEERLTQALERLDSRPSDDRLDISKLASHLSRIQEMMEQSEQRRRDSARAVDDRPPDMDFSPLTERLNRIHASLEKVNSPASPGSGDPRFVLNALTSHLSKIQAVTEQNANAIKTLSTSITTSNEALQHNLEALRKQSARTDSKQLRLDERRGIDMEVVDKRLEATNSQVRELMAGHREMTKVIRELAEAITAQNKGSCDHVVIPPPRKVGRKIVGFVYDGKEDTI